MAVRHGQLMTEHADLRVLGGDLRERTGSTDVSS
jgi:hypothetical protein